ncbi:hypothetical protein BDY24DRAFT_398116 [Mrakia frigida]|uniref:uncharacterized protein n=1 Tax=Mrakia frigida TaxID=29902 RepID=UPI003FCC069A
MSSSTSLKPQRPRYPSSHSTISSFSPLTLLSWQVPFFAATGAIGTLPSALYLTFLDKKTKPPPLRMSMLKHTAQGLGQGGLRFGLFSASTIGLQVALGPPGPKELGMKTLQMGLAGMIAGAVEGLIYGGPGEKGRAALMQAPRVGIAFGIYSALCSYIPVAPSEITHGRLPWTLILTNAIIGAGVSSAVMHSVDPRGMTLMPAVIFGVAKLGMGLGCQVLLVESVMGV